MNWREACREPCQGNVKSIEIRRNRSLTPNFSQISLQITIRLSFRSTRILIRMPFVYSLAAECDQDTVLIVVPTELNDERSLFAWYSSALRFPDYFGANWDAFDECMRDLSWINERKIVVFHENLPLAGNLIAQRTYLEVLAYVIEDWKPGEAHEVQVHFDPRCKLLIDELMG